MKSNEPEVVIRQLPIYDHGSPTGSNLGTPEPGVDLLGTNYEGHSASKLLKYFAAVLVVILVLALAALLSTRHGDSEASRETSWLSNPILSDDWAMYRIEPNIVVWFGRHTSVDERKRLFKEFADQMTSPELESYFATRFSAKDERWQGHLDQNLITYRVVFTKCGTEDCADFFQSQYLGRIEGGIPLEYQWRMNMDSRTIKPVAEAATDLEEYLSVYTINKMSEEEFLDFRRSMVPSR